MNRENFLKNAADHVVQVVPLAGAGALGFRIGSRTVEVAKAHLEYLENFPEQVAEASGLPGPNGGPQDAYRHLIFASEAVRLFGRPIGLALVQLRETNQGLIELVLRGHHVQTDPRDPIRRRMDRHNNRIGADHGELARDAKDSVDSAGRRMIEAFRQAGVGGVGPDGEPRVHCIGSWPTQNLPADWNKQSLPKGRYTGSEHSYDPEKRLPSSGESAPQPDRGQGGQMRRQEGLRDGGSKRGRDLEPVPVPGQTRLHHNERVPIHSPLRKGQPFAEMGREQAREAIEDRLLDEEFSARLLRGDPDALDERSELFRVAFPDGQASDDPRDAESDPDGDILIDVPEVPFDGVPVEDVKRRIERARRDRWFRERLLSGDRAARRRMDRLFATAFPERKNRQSKAG